MASYADSCPGDLGDLVVFRRPCYDHYAVNVGNGDIVHITSATMEDVASMEVARSSNGGFCSSNSLGAIAVVKKEPYANFKKPGDNVTVERQWKSKTAFERIEIVSRALSRVGERGYDLLFKNCEHFARWCRYGEETSDQAINLSIGLGVAAGAVLLGFGAYLLIKSDSEAEKKRKQRNSRQ